jgi:hypothetical protein
MIAQQIVQNGDFELFQPDGVAVSWVVPDLSHNTTYTSQTGPYSGTGGAVFGDWAAVYTDYLYQTVEIPEYAIATLSFYLSIQDVDAGPNAVYNTFTVKIKDRFGQNVLLDLATWNNQDKLVGKGYHKIVFDLSRLAGQTVQIYFSSDQTDALKNSLFYVDQVRIDTLLRLPASTWAPLTSDLSRDFAGAIQQYGNLVYTSCVVTVSETDTFFNPTYGTGLTGFAANGSYYSKGIENPLVKADWWEEATGGGDQTSRGALQPFPPTALILVTEGSVSILNPSDNLSMWMIFRKKPNNAYSDTFGIGAGAKFQPVMCTYDSGLISVTMEPQVGSSFGSNITFCIDFVNDFVFVDLPKA